MSALDDLLTRRRSRVWTAVALTISLMIGGVLVWAGFARFDEVAVATGEVVPRSNVKTIQHLEGGIIETLNVREGDRVRSGDMLLTLRLGANRLNRQEIQVRIASFELRRARLLAEASGAKFTPDPAADPGLAAVAEAESRALDARRRELESSLAVTRSQIEQMRQSLRELEARAASVEQELVLARRQFAMSSNLLKDGLTSKLSHIEAERELQKLVGEKARLSASLPKAAAAREEAERRLTETREIFGRRALEEVALVEAEIGRLRELLAEASAQAARTSIRSPIDGVVKEMRYHTIGGVVQPGVPIMEIVPSGDNLVVEAKLDPVDRGYVREGQMARVKISTYDFIRYGTLEGKVVQIAPGSDTGPGGKPFFRVLVETEKAWLGDSAASLPILPGMGATVDIHTGTRTVLDYFLRPVLKLKAEAFRER